MIFSSWLLVARPTEQKIQLLKTQGLTDQEIEWCIEADPTEKDYVQWIASMYKGKSITRGQPNTKLINLPEDIEKINKQLAIFNKLRRSPKFKGEKDIFKYTPATLYDAVGEGESTLEQGEEAPVAPAEVTWDQMSEGAKREWMDANFDKVKDQILSGKNFAGAELIVDESGETAASFEPHEFKPKYDDTMTCSVCQKLKDGHDDPFVPTEGRYQIIKVTDPRALSALSQGTNWCTKNEGTAAHYLEKGPDYVFFLNGAQYAQWDPNGGNFLNPKDSPFAKETPLRGFSYVTDAQCRAFVAKLQKWFKTNKQPVPETLKPFLTDRAKIEKTIERKKEKGTLTLAQMFELNKIPFSQYMFREDGKTPLSKPEGQKIVQDLADQWLPSAKFADVVWFIKQLQWESNYRRSSSQSANSKVAAAEPYLLQKMTMNDLQAVLTYYKQNFVSNTYLRVNAEKPWPEFEEAAIALLKQGVATPPPTTKDSYDTETTGIEKVGNKLEAFLKQYYYRCSSPWRQDLHDLVLACCSTRFGDVLTFNAFKNYKERDASLEAAMIAVKDDYDMMYYYGGTSGEFAFNNTNSYGSKERWTSPPHIAPKRWPELEQLLLSLLADDKNNRMPEIIKKYEKLCGQKLEGADLTAVEYGKLQKYRAEMEEALAGSEKEDKFRDLKYSTPRTNYCTSLLRLMNDALKKDEDDPKIDTELRWLRDYLKKARDLTAPFNAKQTESYYKITIELPKDFVEAVNKYKSSAWDRRVASWKRANSQKTPWDGIIAKWATENR